MDFIFDNKTYTCIGWSRINFEEEYKYYKEVIEEILENSKFFTPEKGYFLEDWYEEVTPILNNTSKFISIYHPNLLFAFYNQFLKGTYIFKIKE